MKQYSGLDAQQAIIDFLIDTPADALPAEARTHIRDAAAQSDGMTMLVTTMETLYACREECPAGHQLCLELAYMIGPRFNFWGLGGLTGRATQVYGTMVRITDGGAAVEEGDLERHPTYAPAAEPAGTNDGPAVPTGE